jgi:3-oxoacyl-[acyl-carrier protein] reductase
MYDMAFADSETSPGQLIVVGASTPLARSLVALHDGPVSIIGRSNPYDLDNWYEGFDLSTEDGIEQTVGLVTERAKELGGEAAHLLLLQGVSSPDWQESVNVNMVSVARIAEGFAEANRVRHALGSIGLVGSASAYLGGKLAYASTKASLTGLMHGLNRKYGDHTRTNLVVPGVFEGGMIADWSDTKRASVSSDTYANRFATSREIAQALLFCAQNEYVADSVINMTSGAVDIE